MRDFIDELKYMCSSSNTKSRGVYIMIAILLILLPVLSVFTAVLTVISIIKHAFNLIFLITAILALGIFIALVVWLKKS